MTKILLKCINEALQESVWASVYLIILLMTLVEKYMVLLMKFIEVAKIESIANTKKGQNIVEE